MENRTKPETKLSQWDALMLESLKAHGWTGEELISRVKKGELPKDDSMFQFEYAGLTAFANKHNEVFERAVTEGYQIKYNTIRGIHSWILVALQHEAELVLEPGQEAIVASLTEAEAAQLSAVLSFGWGVAAMQEDDAPADGGRSPYRVEPNEASPPPSVRDFIL